MKRFFDIFLVVITLPFWVPAMMIIALLIRAVSAGPVLFKQERIGRGGRKFLCYKFRTMIVGNHESMHRDHLKELLKSNRPMTKLDSCGDRRIIPLGGLLRSSGLDELPQLFNVLFGDMSLVGPRPCLPYEYEEYNAEQRRRCAALPGLTGLWQVSGKNRTTFEQMIRLDITYAVKQSVWLDAQILLKTLPAIFRQMIDNRRAAKPSTAAPQTSVAPCPRLTVETPSSRHPQRHSFRVDTRPVHNTKPLQLI